MSNYFELLLLSKTIKVYISVDDQLFMKKKASFCRGTVASKIDFVKAKFHYAILDTNMAEAGRKAAASWNLAYHLARC